MKNNNLRIDKSKWVKTKLGDLAGDISKRVDNPSNSDYEKFVGLDNFVSGDLKIKKWASAKSVNSSAKAFKKGDILFARRNAYLKRASLVDFDGCCSGDAFVLRENHDKIIPNFLTFVLNSENLWTFANSNAEGTMSKRVKWRDLSNYEVLLPPKEQQAELADLLWAMDELIEKDTELLKKLEKLLENFLVNKIYGNNLKGETINSILVQVEKKVGLESLKNVGIFLKGKGIPKDVVVEKGTPCIRYGQIYTTHHNIIRNFNSFILDSDKTNSFKLNKGDIIFAGSGETITEIGKSVGFIDEFEAYAGGDTIVLRPFSSYNSIFLSYLLNSALVRLQLNKIGTGATVAHIYTEDLKKIKLPKIDLKEQILMAESLENIYNNKARFVTKIQSSKALQKSLINQIF